MEVTRETKRGRWSRSEQARLRELYGLRDDVAIARELRRPVASIRRTALRIFPPLQKGGPWTADETEQLKRYLGATTPEVIARILGRSVGEVIARILELGRVRREGGWSREEIVKFKRLFGTRTDDDLSRIFGRSVDEIRRFADEQKFSKDKAFVRRLTGEPSTRMPRWTEDELALLRHEYPTQSNLEIARKLGRSVKSIVSKAHHMRLKKSSERLREMGRENVRLRYESN